MARNNIIKAIIVADTKNFKDGLDKTARTMDDFGRTMTRRVSLPLAALGVAAIKMGSDLAEASNMAAQVFGSAADDIVAASKNVTDSFSQEEYLSMAGNLGDIAQGMGFTADASADLSTDVLELAQDLGSFKNLPTEQAVRAITSAMTGEREALKSLGIVVNEELVNQRALALGLGDATGKLNQQEKAQATLALITDASARAIGDWDRTSGGAAGQAKILEANMKDMAAELGQNLLPAAEAVLGWATDISAVFANLSPTTQTVVIGFAGLAIAIGPVIRLAKNMTTAFAAARTAALFLAGSTGIGAAIAALSAVAAGLVWLVSRQKVGDDVNRTYTRGIQEMTDAAREYKATLDKVTGAQTELTREHVATEISQAGLTAEFLDAGLSLDTFMASLTGFTPEAIAARNEVDRFAFALKNNTNVSDGQRDAFLELQLAAIGVARESDNVEALMGPLGTSIDNVARATRDVTRDYSDMIADFQGSLGTQVEVDRLFDNIVATLGDLDNMTLTEIQQEILDTTADLAGIMESASPADVLAMKGRIDEIRFMILLLGEAGAISQGQVDGLLRSLRMLSPTMWERSIRAGGGLAPIPHGATGGIVTKPTLAMIGEAGPEAVIPLSSTPGSSPLPGGMGGGGGGPVHVTLEVDGRVLAQVVADANRDSGGVFV